MLFSYFKLNSCEFEVGLYKGIASFILLNSGNKMAENYIVDFDPDFGINGLIYFDKLCCKENKDAEWKFEDILKYFKGGALKIYINGCLIYTQFDQIVEFEMQRPRKKSLLMSLFPNFQL